MITFDIADDRGGVIEPMNTPLKVEFTTSELAKLLGIIGLPESEIAQGHFDDEIVPEALSCFREAYAVIIASDLYSRPLEEKVYKLIGLLRLADVHRQGVCWA
jgi:hypothetical protein